MTNTGASTKCRIINTISMNVTNVFLSAVSFDFNAINSISIITRAADALIAIKVLVKFTVSEWMALVDDIARN
jgi:hypothetical protein